MLRNQFATKKSSGGDIILKIDSTRALRTSTTEKSSHLLTYKLKSDIKIVVTKIFVRKKESKKIDFIHMKYRSGFLI